jgi:two-component system, LytTR family, response regulator AlgR
MSEPRLRTLIVDDEPLAIERLQRLCAHSPSLQVVASALSGSEALDLVPQCAPDLLLLDIGMAGLDGLAVARRLRGGSAPVVVFTTAFDSFAVAAFELAAVDYLLKPVEAERLELAAARAAQRLRSSAAKETVAGPTDLWIPHRGELIRLSLADLDRISAERDYVRIHCGSRSYLLHGTLAGFERRLAPADFVRVHRSEIVRCGAVASLSHDGGGSWVARLQDGSSVKIGRSYLETVRLALDVQRPKG